MNNFYKVLNDIIRRHEDFEWRKLKSYDNLISTNVKYKSFWKNDEVYFVQVQKEEDSLVQGRFNYRVTIDDVKHRYGMRLPPAEFFFRGYDSTVRFRGIKKVFEYGLANAKHYQ